MQTQLFPETIAEQSSIELGPPLKWAGGKRWLLPHIRPTWANHTNRRLVEPFTGGMAISLGLKPNVALLNDVNSHLVNFYRCLQRGLVITIPMANDKDLYYKYRERFNELIRTNQESTEEAASLFYYLNRTGFNGLCRFNSRGEFNVPFGRYKTINYTTNFTRYIQILQNWDIQLGDFSKLILDVEDFVYADPPYDVEFTTYSPGGFTWDDQVRLADWLSKHSGPVVVSNQATNRVLELYERLGFHIETLNAPRLIACNGNRTPAREMLATKGL